ncbi:hypothetical protein HMPREF2978_04750 [Corynebacterium sp. HMSC074C01]|nr:hypothetical protein HMPREF2978_04750 [Corynebacterium sp. HMSC074C01]
MTAPSMDLYLPKTYVFKRGSEAYATRAPMVRVDDGRNFVFLPKGLSLVTVIATSMDGASMELTLNQGTDYSKTLAAPPADYEATKRIWTGHISNPRTGMADGGVYLRIYAERVTTKTMNNGSVSIQVINFPPES